MQQKTPKHTTHPSSCVPQLPGHTAEDSDIKQACHVSKLRLVHVGQGLKPHHSLMAAAVRCCDPRAELAVGIQGELLVQGLSQRLRQLSVDAADQLVQDQGV